MNDLILFTSLHKEDDILQLNMCRLLSTYSTYNTYLYYPNENRSKIWNALPKIKIWDKPLRTIINKTIMVWNYSEAFLELDASNKIIYVTNRSSLIDQQLLLLGKLSGVIASTVENAHYIASQARANNIQLSTINLLPWLDPKNYQITKQIANKPAMLPYSKSDHGAFAISDDIVNILQLMLSGKPVIVSPSYQELVIDNYNGFIASTQHEMLLATKKMQNTNTIEFGIRSRQIVEALMDPQSYLRKLEKFIEELPIIPNCHTKSLTDRKWVVTNKVMANGKIQTIPDAIDSKFAIAEYTNILNILNFFANQHYSEAYVFGFEFPNCSPQEINQLKIITNRMGARARKIFFCFDEPVPNQWTPVFNNLGILSQAEGLKQVK